MVFYPYICICMCGELAGEQKDNCKKRIHCPMKQERKCRISADDRDRIIRREKSASIELGAVTLTPRVLFLTRAYRTRRTHTHAHSSAPERNIQHAFSLRVAHI